jgi:hypothetical protein
MDDYFCITGLLAKDIAEQSRCVLALRSYAYAFNWPNKRRILINKLYGENKYDR